MTKLALITGGSRGLGRSSVLALAEAGVDVIFTYLANHDAAVDVIEQVQAFGQKAACLQFDVRDFAKYQDFADELETLMMREFGVSRFDYLLNNAGTGLNRPYVETKMEDFDELFNIHLKSPYFLTQTLLNLMNDGGHVVNVSSGLARFCLPGASAYAVMKGGVEVFTRYLAKELGERGISVNTLAPGAIATDFNGGAVRDNLQLNEFIAGVTAKGRVGQPDDIGAVVSALLSEKSYWVTGQRIEVSGGMFL